MRDLLRRFNPQERRPQDVVVFSAAGGKIQEKIHFPCKRLITKGWSGI
jgi:hypothetical protein